MDIVTGLPGFESHPFPYLSIVCEILRRACYFISYRLSRSLLFIPGYSRFSLAGSLFFPGSQLDASCLSQKNQEIYSLVCPVLWLSGSKALPLYEDQLSLHSVCTAGPLRAFYRLLFLRKESFIWSPSFKRTSPTQ